MINKVVNIIKKSKNIVFFTGAGISTESNIPDFRSKNGLYNCYNKYGFNPEDILSYSFFKTKPKIFFKYYFENIVHINAKPNDGHKCIYEIEKLNYNVNIITQNIDGLHQMADCKNVIELHGSIYKNFCINCSKIFNINYIVKNKPNIPKCDQCNSIIRPDVTLYEEQLDNSKLEKSIKAIKNADILFVLGTSLVVQPAASLINYYKNKNIVIINKSQTPYDRKAAYIFNDSCGKILNKIVHNLRENND